MFEIHTHETSMVAVGFEKIVEHERHSIVSVCVSDDETC